MDNDKFIGEKALTKTKEIITFVSRFNGQVNIGRLRGVFTESIDRKESLVWVLSAFEELAEYA